MIIPPRDHLATVRAHYPRPIDVVYGKVLERALQPADPPVAIIERSAPTRLVTRITDDSLPYGGQWEFTLTPDGDGTILTITERGFVTPAFFRLMARYVFGFTRTMVQYHRTLAAALDTTVTPEVTATGH
jgi:hypothetical protein